jgi:competence protein ComGC
MRHSKRSAPFGARCPAFTPIQMLVVVSIIALLIALLLPALRSTRETARASACASTIRQVGLGVLVSSDSHREQLMWAMWRTADGRAGLAPRRTSATA